MADDRDHGNRDWASVRTEIAEQPAHQSAVVGFPENVFLVHFLVCPS
jgi:hypothetical protein